MCVACVGILPRRCSLLQYITRVKNDVKGDDFMDINKYSKQELIQIIKCYDQYLQDWFDEDEDLRAGQEPVCIYEFIDNEYQEMLDAGYKNYNDFISGL